jgi:hypothetical protein
VRFVLGNHRLFAAGGAETHIATLGDQLLRLGHEVVVYCPEPGRFAGEIRARGLDIVLRAVDLPLDRDAVLAQDRRVLLELVGRYASSVMAFRMCSEIDFHLPPQVNGDLDLVVALGERYAKVARSCAVDVPLLRLRIPIDTGRLRPLSPIRRRPRRAAILGNYPDRVYAVRKAWEPYGIEVIQIGGRHQRYDVAAALDGIDIVVAKGRAALDAMACGRAVYLYDIFGGDGWITPATYPDVEADHFAGQATNRVIEIADLTRDLADYDATMGTTNRDLVLQHHDARAHAGEFVAAVRTALEAKRKGCARDGGDRGDARLRERLVHAERRVAQLETDLDEIRSSRAWRSVRRLRGVRDRALRLRR